MVYYWQKLGGALCAPPSFCINEPTDCHLERSLAKSKGLLQSRTKNIYRFYVMCKKSVFTSGLYKRKKNKTDRLRIQLKFLRNYFNFVRREVLL